MKQKSDFKELHFINPFDPEWVNKMVYPEWAKQDVLMKWRRENCKFLKDPSHIDLLDIDELITQWNVKPELRKVNPRTCNMVYKELCLILRLVDAEHQDAIYREGIPGVIESTREPGKFLYMDYNIEKSDNLKKAVKTIVCDTEFDAYWRYMQNRNGMLESTATKAYEADLIDPDLFDKYFYDLDNICVRDYEYYKEKRYKDE